MPWFFRFKWSSVKKYIFLYDAVLETSFLARSQRSGGLSSKFVSPPQCLKSALERYDDLGTEKSQGGKGKYLTVSHAGWRILAGGKTRRQEDSREENPLYTALSSALKKRLKIAGYEKSCSPPREYKPGFLMDGWAPERGLKRRSRFYSFYSLY